MGSNIDSRKLYLSVSLFYLAAKQLHYDNLTKVLDTILTLIQDRPWNTDIKKYKYQKGNKVH